MGNTQRQNFSIFPPEADLVPPKNIFHIVKDSLFDPNKLE